MFNLVDYVDIFTRDVIIFGIHHGRRAFATKRAEVSGAQENLAIETVGWPQPKSALPP